MKVSHLSILAIILLSFATSVFVYPQLPGKVPMHWNASNEPDSFASKEWAIFLIPGISVFLALLSLVIPRIDPKKKNIEMFRGCFDWFIVVLMGFLYYMHVLMIFLALGLQLQLVQMLSPGLGALFYSIGVLMSHVKQNWFIGIRTPWTLSSERVWDRTHQKGGKVFKACGVVAVLGLALPALALWLIIAPIIVGAAYLFAYSYIEYRRLKK